jgi:hypothetical protein
MLVRNAKLGIWLMMDVVVRVKDGWSSDVSRMFDILLLNAG